MIKTEASLVSRCPVTVNIQTQMCLSDILNIERVLDKLLDEITRRESAHFLGGMEHALELLDLKPERLLADDGNEHYFIPKLHSLVEDTKTAFRVLRMGDPLN